MHFSKVVYDPKPNHSKVLLISHAATALNGYNHPQLTKVTCHHYAMLFAAETDIAFVMFIAPFLHNKHDKTSTACLIFKTSFITLHHA